MWDWSRTQGPAPPAPLEVVLLVEVVVPELLVELVVSELLVELVEVDVVVPPPVPKVCVSAVHAESEAVAVASTAHRASGFLISMVAMRISCLAVGAAD